MDRSLDDDLKKDALILEKVKDDRYAQNVYAALCNMRWQPQEVWPVLQDDYWSCSWRYAGGIVANLVGSGDYMDWYCSGITGGYDSELDTDEHNKGHVAEGVVTDEIREDFARIGWHPSPWPKDNK